MDLQIKEEKVWLLYQLLTNNKDSLKKPLSDTQKVAFDSLREEFFKLLDDKGLLDGIKDLAEKYHMDVVDFNLDHSQNAWICIYCKKKIDRNNLCNWCVFIHCNNCECPD